MLRRSALRALLAPISFVAASAIVSGLLLACGDASPNTDGNTEEARSDAGSDARADTATVPSIFNDAAAADGGGGVQDATTPPDAQSDAQTACEAGTDFQNDVNNCGSCGIVCGAKAAMDTPQCVAGVCRTITTLVTGQAHPTAIALAGIGNGAVAVWTNTGIPTTDGSVRRAFLNDGATDVLASNQNFPWGLSVASGWAFWATHGQVMDADIGNLRGTHVVADNMFADAVIADSNYVYWSDSVTHTITRSGWPGSGPMPEKLAENVDTQTGFLQQNTDSLFFTNGIYVSSMSKNGGSITNLASVTSEVTAFAADDANLYYVTNDELWGVPMVNGAGHRIAQGVGFYSIAVDGSSVYGPDLRTGRILRIPKAGGAPVALAKFSREIGGIAVDGTNVYWTNYDDGTVVRTAK